MSFGKSVPIELGGKTRNLKYGFNALVDLEETLNIPVEDLLNIFSGKVKLGDLRAVLWAGLKHEEPGLTVEQVGDMLDVAFNSGENFQKIGEAVAQSITASFPVAPKQPKGRAPKN
jgi:hypothetical protein